VIQSVGIMTQSEQSVWRIAASSSYRLQYVLRGCAGIMIDGHTYDYRENDIYFEHKGEKIESRLADAEKWSVIHFAFDGALAEALIAAHDLNDVHKINGKNMRKHFDALLCLARTGSPNFHRKGAVIIHALLEEIAARINPERSRRYSPMVKKIKTHLDNNPESVVTMKMLGRLAGKSASQVQRAFKQETGCTPYQYFLRQKLRTAGYLLQFTGMSVKEIAFRLNFNDPYAFSKSFKKHLGLYPREFRTDSRKP